MNQVIYFAAGCFWGAQHFFVQVDGVCEAVARRVRYDDRKITLRELVRLFFTIIDPTSVNRQGSDVGAFRAYFSWMVKLRSGTVWAWVSRMRMVTVAEVVADEPGADGLPAPCLRARAGL